MSLNPNTISLSLGDNTKRPTRVDVSLNPNLINRLKAYFFYHWPCLTSNVLSKYKPTMMHFLYICLKLISVLFVRLFDLCLFGFVGFLFLLVSGKGCGLWHSLDFSLTFFYNNVKIVALSVIQKSGWLLPSGHIVFIQRRFIVDATS